MNGRLSRVVHRADSDPGAMAEQLSTLAAERSEPQVNLDRLRPAPLPTAPRLGAMVERSFTPARKVLLDFSPMQN